jgi:hypothetical protein
MTIKFADRVLETSTTTGTGTINLAGATTNFRTFVAGAGNGAKVTYLISDNANWEVGIGTVTSGSPNTLSRTTILASSNANAAVNWGAGTRNVYLTMAASVMMKRDESMNFTDLLGTGGGTANAHTVAMPVTSLALSDGMVFFYRPTIANTTAGFTINVDTTGAKAAKVNGADPGIGFAGIGDLIFCIYKSASNILEIVNLSKIGEMAYQTRNLTIGINETKTTVASATTPDIWTNTGNIIDYTGTTAATGFAAAPQAGARRTLVCAAACSFTHGANLIIPGSANYTAAAGDIITVTAVTTTQFRLSILKADGTSVVVPPSGVFTTSFESSEIAITAGGTHSASHGLGGIPKFWYAVIRCKTAEFNYAVGDEVVVQGGDAASTNSSAVWANATTVGVKPASGYTFNIINLTTGGNGQVTAANWRVVLRAYK